MLLLGLLSIVQVLFLPGFLLLYRMQDIQRVDKLLLAVPLSACLNFFLVYALVLLHAYTHTTILAIFSLELAALAFFKWKDLKGPNTSPLPTQNEFKFKFDFTGSLFLLFVLIYSCQFINHMGAVFTQSDAVINWNPWGVSWFEGHIPQKLAWYPQLLPTLYSLTYQFIAESRVEIFAKLAVSCYPLIALALFARIAALLPAERYKILWSAMICFLLVRRLWGGESTINGYADFPLTFFALALLYVFILKAVEAPSPARTNGSTNLAIVLVCVAIGTSLVKQSGVYLGMLVPFVWLFFFRNGAQAKAHFRQSLFIGLAIAVASATWYLYQYWRISSGQEYSNLSELANLLNLTWYESIAFGFSILNHKLSWLWVALFLASLLHRKVRYLSLFVVLPFMLLWGAFVPYDFRNLAPVFPMFALALVYGWSELASRIENVVTTRFDRSKFRRLATLVLLVGLAFALSNHSLDKELIKLSDTGKSQIGDPEINNRLVAFFEFNPENALVATPYGEISKIPHLSSRYAPLSCSMYGDNKEAAKLETLTRELSDPSIRYLLLLPWCDANILKHFADHPEEYQPIFKASDAVFYRIVARHQ